MEPTRRVYALMQADVGESHISAFRVLRDVIEHIPSDTAGMGELLAEIGTHPMAFQNKLYGLCRMGDFRTARGTCRGRPQTTTARSCPHFCVPTMFYAPFRE